jgi:hypothetical protein
LYDSATEYGVGVWAEQCWRDVLKVVWNISSSEALAKVLPFEVLPSSFRDEPDEREQK